MEVSHFWGSHKEKKRDARIEGETWTGSMHRAEFWSLWVVYRAYRECKLRERVGRVRRVGVESRVGVVLLMISRRG